MKPGSSVLNPYAAAYVPLSKRERYFSDEELVSAKPATSSDMAYKQMRDEDLEMDMEIEFLLVLFSDLSHESINDVYLANNGDLDATIEMLNQLEIYSSESQEYLKDTLDIVDVPETTEPSTSKVSKQKNANNEASASSSSSGIPNSHVSS